METTELIELRYDAIQRTYYVARPRKDRSSIARRPDADSNDLVTVELNVETQITVWTQPGLF